MTELETLRQHLAAAVQEVSDTHYACDEKLLASQSICSDWVDRYRKAMAEQDIAASKLKDAEERAWVAEEFFCEFCDSDCECSACKAWASIEICTRCWNSLAGKARLAATEATALRKASGMMRDELMRLHEIICEEDAQSIETLLKETDAMVNASGSSSAILTVVAAARALSEWFWHDGPKTDSGQKHTRLRDALAKLDRGETK